MSSEAFRLDNKTALVTGGASGIGAQICREFDRAGASVLVADINLEAAQTMAASLQHGTAVKLDVTESASVAAAVATVSKLDILVNNAGIGHVGSVETTQFEDFDKLMKVNVYSIYLVTQGFLPLILASHGSIVNIGSVAGNVGIKQRFGYCATKGAVHAMTRQIAVEYPKELRVNAIAPGTVQTPFVEGYLEKYHSHEKEKIREQLVARQPIGRLGTPEDVASMARYLVSDEASFITGSILTIDGGWTAA